MSHRHFCDVTGHWWDCEGTALRLGDKEPSVCLCLKCGVPLELGSHIHDYVELLACPEHRKADEAITAPHQAAPGAERGVLRDKDGNRIVGFCLWCDEDFYSLAEVDVHNADNMKACPVHEELTNRPGGYPYMPPILQIILEQAGLLKGHAAGESGDPDPKK
jgi:hypothetical protein